MAIKPILFFAGAASLAGCVASIPPVQVTRFHSEAQLAPGGVVIVPAGGGDPQGLEFRTYAAAVARELNTLGLSETRDAQSPYVATVEYARDTREGLVKRSPFSIGIGGGSFGRGGGIGLGTSFGIGKSRSNDIVATRLGVQLRKRAQTTAIWEGRAETQAPARAPSAQPGLAADKLAAALFKNYPGISGQTVTVP